MDNIKQHFQEEARDFDRIILTLIPDYPRMVEALVAALPFQSAASVKVIDLHLLDSGFCPPCPFPDLVPFPATRARKPARTSCSMIAVQ
jgi:hypothetical protein